MTQPIQQPNSTNINRNLPAMSAVLPCKPGEGQEINQFVAVLRGYPLASTAEAWPADSEEACRRHADFLAVWLKMPQIGKAEMRCSLKKANSKLSASEQKAIANAMMGAKTWLNRKKRNMKTGEKTPPVFQKLLQALDGPGSAQPGEGSSSHKRKSGNQPEQQPSLKKAKAGITIVDPVEEEQERLTEVWEIQSSVPPTQESLVAAEELARAHMKRPAAATASKKKPAKAPSHKPATAKGCKKKPGEGKGWQKSASFGWIKQTRASKKAYIQAKPGEGQDKAHCLVNVGLPAGPKQDKVMDAVFAKALGEESLEKASLVKFKNELLAGPLDVD